ncbi:50S ribosomal protein L10, chloroplastic [Phalaenopsis equestris]|uniref:50S ribosomal protein L10, chloroplastic n=1 Tax=Phalaenopsis equestris TaxID=78828 RepID=UPI0009E2ED4B|nr:50S ribosomal protein L10, chloroplastic [Phalaenopsis equestris]XP_020579651.1 50S ribosomal protein L10, chloroplastic [Phalaenopsis equestris]XP_020579652.1 50S ribosomal protein L10, chloroplastic [Phalaenopsis equestris]XP_020579653.1 50S ribosomal protein L10, chloroplastic [Phalaenopsis equestris]XP_020579654.1 50S ribosomal protein L10, chloroplastic [Phalaenopsis equestris]
MEISLHFSSSFPSQPIHALSPTRAPTLPNLPNSSPLRRHRLPTIRAAISRTKKEQTIDSVKNQLENCYLLAGISFKGFTVKQFQELRRSLPDSVHLMVAKNTLVGKAIEGTRWDQLRPCMKGMNAWLFVHTEEIPEALKPYRSFQREKKLEENDFVGGVFEGKFYGPEEFRILETMPSREEIYAKLLGSLQSPAIGIIGTLQAPARELVMLLKAYVQKLEEESNGGVATA